MTNKQPFTSETARRMKRSHSPSFLPLSAYESCQQLFSEQEPPSPPPDQHPFPPFHCHH